MCTDQCCELPAKRRPAVRPKDLVPAAWARPVPPPRQGEPPRLWLGRVEVLRDALAPLAGSVMDSGERARAAAFRRAVDRDGYRVAHTGLRLLLGACLGIEPSEVPLARQACPLCRAPHGRPVVRGAAVHFSVSRTPGYCLLAIAATPVGADVEKYPSVRAADEVGAMMHPQESDELAACTAQERPAAFARAWTRKEAYLKGLGTGLGHGLCFARLGTSPHAPVHVPGWAVSDVAVERGHAAAVAVRAATEAP